ncbi:MAG: hypothetical protein ABIY55_10915 [Kofleriaceae bacterium]
MRSLLDSDPDTVERDREAEREEPRAGVWGGEIDSDLLRLTQDQTDLLIRSELLALARASERAELLRAFGEPEGGWRGGINVPWSGCSASTVAETRTASVQRGGLDADPLVRVLAARAWGDRDRRWFAERGVRAGDVVSIVLSGRNGVAVARIWPRELSFASVVADAAPGENVMCAVVRDFAMALPVADRVRIAPDAEGGVQPRAYHPGQRIYGIPSRWLDHTGAWNKRQRHHRDAIRAGLDRGMSAESLARHILLATSPSPVTLAEAGRLVYEHTEPALAQSALIAARWRTT